NFLLPTGPRHNPVGLLVLGGGPTRDEVKQQEHLAGMMGKEMTATLEEAGIERSKSILRDDAGDSPSGCSGRCPGAINGLPPRHRHFPWSSRLEQ
ncbi:MAG TPA: hypothetical protein PKJ66_10650, partial [Rhodocyclaceae bacterium]|nr:hypothetical protein [Rhodocyclaceae bacterium]